MKLRIKTVAIFGVTVLLFVLLLYLVNDYLFLRGYKNLELQEFAKVKNIVEDKINNEKLILNQISKTYASDFSSFKPENNYSDEFDFAYRLSPSNDFSPLYINPQKSLLDLSSLLENYQVNNLIEEEYGTIYWSGVFYFYGIHRITGSSDNLLILKELTPQIFSAAMSELVFQFNYTQIKNNPNKTIQSVAKELSEKTYVFSPINDEMASYYFNIKDINNKSVFVAQIGMSRTTYKLGKAHAQNIFLLISLLSLFSIALMLIVVEFLILGRFEKLQTQVKVLAEGDDDTSFISLGGNDELTSLAEQIETTIRTKRFYYKSLKESELLYKSIFEFSADGYIILSKHNTVTYCNKKFNEIFGYNFDEIEDKNIYELIGGKTDNSGLIRKEKRKRKDGTEITVEVVSTQVTVKHTPVILERYTDVTEITRLEEEAKLQQLKMQQTDKLASLGLLVSGVAHEINNPNNFISLNIPYIEQYFNEIFPILDEHASKNPEFKIGNINYKLFRDDLKDLLIDLNEGSKRITSIVNELKNFAKVEPEDSNNLFDINELINSTLRLLAPQIKAKNCNILFLNEKEYIIKGSKQKLGQVIINCLTNALDAVENNKGEISISFIEEKNNLTCLIKDNGKGIEPIIMKHIFDPFFTTKLKEGGTGLGLSVAKSIVETMGHSISIQSEPGKGTTVILNFTGEEV